MPTALQSLDRFGPANQVTAVRAALVVLLAALGAEPAGPAAAAGMLATASVAAALDGVDGWLARRTRTVSAFGARFDMEVDALLVLVLAVLVWRHDKAGAWVLLSGLMRYLFVAAGWLLPWMRQPLPPSRRRQTLCVVQTIGLIAALAPAVTPPLSDAIAAAALVVLAGSFMVDILWLRQHACA
jgi:phosphatidylglycerophosphate synthase